ncbi:MAG TPA: class I SAM-dependent methyltransferase [Thermoanaerobaculia bacterium]|nr:class I SAM-dependent methyltransferase [Thermoanaerobaculia bacterium]
MWRRSLRRAYNAARKLAAGVSLFGESASPLVPNDLFQAHASIYHFFGRYAAGRDVLEIGCGTGYGAAILRARGARSVVAIDTHRGNLRYARRQNADEHVQFREADAAHLPDDIGRFELVVSSNVFEHLRDVGAAIAGVRRLLKEGGTFILAVPPILDERALEDNRRNPYHLTNLYAGQWRDFLARTFADVTPFAHLAPEGARLDFGDPFPSQVWPESFRFVAAPLDQFAITAVFVCHG